MNFMAGKQVAYLSLNLLLLRPRRTLRWRRNHNESFAAPPKEAPQRDWVSP